MQFCLSVKNLVSLMGEEARSSLARRMNLPNLPMMGSSVDTEDLSILVQELRELGFDAIRFSSYRTAAKLRYIQKKSKFILVDIWNVIEAIRDHGLNAENLILTVPKLESLVISLYSNLNKRLPPQSQVDVLNCSRYLLSWLLIAYDSEGSGRLRVFSAKIGLATLCNGKLVDKLRYIFSQISDSNGLLVLPRFSEFLQEILAIPSMVLESPTFGYTEGLCATIFDAGTTKININNFLDVMLSEPGPPCLMWMPLLSIMASVEEVNHGIQCNVCKCKNIQGFRYKCVQCRNFNICQTCFWQGKISDNHKVEHEVKEYSNNGKLGKSFRNSFRKSLTCVPEKSRRIQRYPDQERPLNLSHIVPASPLPQHNGFQVGGQPIYSEPMDAYNDQKMFAFDMMQVGQQQVQGPNKVSHSVSSYPDSLASESGDEEHRLIARYTARLASENKYPAPRSRTVSQQSMSLGNFDSTKSQRNLILELEARNREIMLEIAKLREQQEMDMLNGDPSDPVVYEELHALREHKTDLEDKLANLQGSRNQLMADLEGLMRLLKIQQLTPKSGGSSPKSPYEHHSGHSHSHYSHSHSHHHRPHHRSAPGTPQHHSLDRNYLNSFPHGHHSQQNYDDFHLDYNNPSEDSMQMSTGGNSNGSIGSRSLRNDLLLAADSVSNAMAGLVKELNSDEDSSPVSISVASRLSRRDQIQIQQDSRIVSRILKPLDYPVGENNSAASGGGGAIFFDRRKFSEEEKRLDELRLRRRIDDVVDAETSPPERQILEKELQRELQLKQKSIASSGGSLKKSNSGGTTGGSNIIVQNVQQPNLQQQIQQQHQQQQQQQQNLQQQVIKTTGVVVDGGNGFPPLENDRTDDEIDQLTGQLKSPESDSSWEDPRFPKCRTNK